ncbi:hypothetical protein ACOJQI_02875 [Bacillus salacetis]|uniref:hypothetical protein n=1 Tax=Bacillus salacetis TaxID=2315464 RepID=UPI003B9FFC33
MNYIRDFLEINSKDTNEEVIENLLFLSVAVLSEIILDRLHFEKNKDLKEFTTEILLESYKDYLFDSRPALYARIIKDLRDYKMKNQDHFLQLEQNIQEFLSTKYNEEFEGNIQNETSKKTPSGDNKKQKNGNKKVIEGWRSIIES